jgi:hypothetical protein
MRSFVIPARLALSCRLLIALAALGLGAIPALGQVPPRPELLRVRRLDLRSVGLLRERFRLIDIIPNSLSGEDDQDSEPNLAVNPANWSEVVASAFTADPTGATNVAPIFVSQNGGTTWDVNSIVPSGNGSTGDISLAYAGLSNTLFTGTLRGGSGFLLNILRSANPFGATIMDVLVTRTNIDQPWMEARTTAPAGANVDRVYVGNNDLSGASGRTASVELSLDAATNPAPAGFTTARLEVRTTRGQDMPPIRASAHADGTIYSVHYRWASGNVPGALCDVVVTRDDTWGSGGPPFNAALDPGDTQRGVRVASGVLVPAFPAFLGANRLVASNLSIAVDPRTSDSVWVAWADRVGTTDYTLHVRRSNNRGANWSGDLLTITNATNPALAVTSRGVVGFLYQQLTGVAPNRRWETHFRRSTTGASWSDLTLANTPDNNPAPTFQPYLGDYVDLVALNRTFFGIFSASNIPDLANFPQGVTYQRNANFTSHQLLDLNGVTPVGASIDPFFFRIDPPLVIDFCTFAPAACIFPKLSKNLIEFECTLLPCRVVDPIPDNCKLKFPCPGCEIGLCPPWYHMFIDGVDPRIWDVALFTREGDLVKYVVKRTPEGVIVSFKPSQKLYRRGEIGDYVLTFESDKVQAGAVFGFKTRLETSTVPLEEHLRRK